MKYNKPVHTNNRKSTSGRRRQIVYSEPQLILVGKSMTEKGRRLLYNLHASGLSESEIRAKYEKNRYAYNVNAKPVRSIIHR